MIIGSRIPRQPAKQAAVPAVMPPPVKGIDASSPAGNQPPDTSIYSYNMMPVEYGMEIRKGYREWAIDLETAPDAGDGVRSIFGYDGTDIGAADNKLFATTKEGIWDVTEYDTAPARVITFADTGADAGYGVTEQYIDQAGVDYLFYADSTNGLYEYNGQTEAWGRPAGITGVAVEDIAFIAVHKQRVWLVERGAASAWYLPVASKSGAATEFFFGSKLPHGGALVGLYNWSIDDGAGIDDILVAVSASGDIVPYKGDDPSTAATWSIVGSYYVGELPKGRRVVSEYGGEMYILSAFGIISMTDLLQGTARDVTQSVSFRIAKPLRQKIGQLSAEWGWTISFAPSIGAMVITRPAEESFPEIQYVMNLTTQAWGYWRSVPMTCFADWNGVVYFGTADNRVCAMDVTRDNVKITQTTAVDAGSAVKYSLMTSYSRMDAPAIWKQVQLIRPDFWSVLPPSFEAQALYDYDISELTEPTFFQEAQADTWDVGLWDTAVWGGGDATGQSRLTGSYCFGRAVAIAIRGEAVETIQLLSIDVLYTKGGPT